MQELIQDKRRYTPCDAPCPYFGTCGGCTLQDLRYDDQLALKQSRLQRAFAPLIDLPHLELIPLEDPWRYRNRAELTFSEEQGVFRLGYHRAGSFWQIVDLEDCLLLPEPIMRVARDVRELARTTSRT